MSPAQTSIQSFYKKELPEASAYALPSSTRSRRMCISPCDGFTEGEIAAVLNPISLLPWRPQTIYRDLAIDGLEPGPGCVAVTGRVVQFHEYHVTKGGPQAANGYFKICLRDDTGAMTVRLWYLHIPYCLYLGQLVKVWTPHVSHTSSGLLSFEKAPLVSSICPETDHSTYFQTLDEDDGTRCKRPLAYREGRALAGLMTLRTFVDGGHDITEGIILVCVKSIGPKVMRKVNRGKENEVDREMTELKVFDNTAEATLTLWAAQATSPSRWKPSETVLLITNPGFRSSMAATISITHRTSVDVDPEIGDAVWLRDWAMKKAKSEHVNRPFPEGVFDVQAALTSELRLLFTLADIDEWSRAAPGETYMGYFSLVMLELNIVKMHQRSMLCSNQCCGVPYFANATAVRCKQCEKKLVLRLNPRVVGTLIDETGSIAPGQLVWSNEAWTQLLGCPADDLVKEDSKFLKILETRMLFLRLTLLLGWNPEVGKLAVLQIMA